MNSSNSKKEAYLLVFSASWCSHSRRLEKEFNDAKISYTLVEAEIAQNLSLRYKIEHVPTIYLVDKQENIIQKWEGYDDKDPGQTKIVNVIRHYTIIPYPSSQGVKFCDNNVQVDPVTADFDIVIDMKKISGDADTIVKN